MGKNNCTRFLPAILGVFLFLVAIPNGFAASVRQVNIDEMLEQCQFVFEGNVVSVEARENSQKRIHTYVTFEIRDVIKGDYPSDSITLSFLGGTVGDVTMAVSDMKFPQIDEHGIYFVESLSKAQVHPLYGWSQGHFLVEADDSGLDRVMTNSREPVTGLEGGGAVEQMKSEPLQGPSKGVASGLTLAQTKKEIRGLTADEFKTALHERMRKGQ